MLGDSLHTDMTGAALNGLGLGGCWVWGSGVHRFGVEEGGLEGERGKFFEGERFGPAAGLDGVGPGLAIAGVKW